MDLNEVAERLGVSKRTIMRWVDQGRFPGPGIRSRRLIAWTDYRIEQWCRGARKMGKVKHNRKVNHV